MQSKYHEVDRYLLGRKFEKTNKYFERFGYKRRRLDNTYPKLCPYYDEFFYQNDNISTQFNTG